MSYLGLSVFLIASLSKISIEKAVGAWLIGPTPSFMLLLSHSPSLDSRVLVAYRCRMLSMMSVKMMEMLHVVVQYTMLSRGRIANCTIQLYSAIKVSEPRSRRWKETVLHCSFLFFLLLVLRFLKTSPGVRFDGAGGLGLGFSGVLGRYGGHWGLWTRLNRWEGKIETGAP